MSQLHQAAPAAAGSFAFVHQPLPPAERWRCAVLDLGFGLVTGLTRMAQHVVSYDVELDSGADAKALPNQLRRLPSLTLVKS